jgi:hypothetical protein
MRWAPENTSGTHSNCVGLLEEKKSNSKGKTLLKGFFYRLENWKRARAPF